VDRKALPRQDEDGTELTLTSGLSKVEIFAARNV
jgi:hypothetical protein